MSQAWTFWPDPLSSAQPVREFSSTHGNWQGGAKAPYPNQVIRELREAKLIVIANTHRLRAAISGSKCIGLDIHRDFARSRSGRKARADRQGVIEARPRALTVHGRALAH